MSQAWLEHIWQAVRRIVSVPVTGQLDVVIVGDRTMRVLNARYRGVTSVTDVLSFGYSRNSGEVVICYPQALRQARSKQHPIQRECAWLVVHGILHWLGYDHESAQDAKVMRPLERHILAYV
jgi:probable rRNA maturation factor